MVQYPTDREIFCFITGDFQCTWDALAEKPESVAANRGNFIFALQACILLEWASRLCHGNPTAHKDFSTALHTIEPKYFTPLPAKYRAPDPREFTLPGVGPAREKALLGGIWDLIRNGQAHHYHDFIVTLTDHKQWGLELRGVQYAWPLSKVAASRAALAHLTYRMDAHGDVLLTVHAGVFFLDIRDAIDQAHLLSGELTSSYVRRGRSGPPPYQFTVSQLAQALESGGHGKR